MFADGFDAFSALQTPIWVRGHPLNPSGLRGGVWGLGRFGGIWGGKSTQKKFWNVFGDTLGGY